MNLDPNHLAQVTRHLVSRFEDQIRMQNEDERSAWIESVERLRSEFKTREEALRKENTRLQIKYSNTVKSFKNLQAQVNEIMKLKSQEAPPMQSLSLGGRDDHAPKRVDDSTKISHIFDESDDDAHLMPRGGPQNDPHNLASTSSAAVSSSSVARLSTSNITSENVQSSTLGCILQGQSSSETTEMDDDKVYKERLSSEFVLDGSWGSKKRTLENISTFSHIQNDKYPPTPPSPIISLKSHKRKSSKSPVVDTSMRHSLSSSFATTTVPRSSVGMIQSASKSYISEDKSTTTKNVENIFDSTTYSPKSKMDVDKFNIKVEKENEFELRDQIEESRTDHEKQEETTTTFYNNLSRENDVPMNESRHHERLSAKNRSATLPPAGRYSVDTSSTKVSASGRRSTIAGGNSSSSSSRGGGGSTSSSKPQIKCVETIRNKAERETLPGFACTECKAWYDAMVKNQYVSKDELPTYLKECSRHKSRWEPSSTPPGFWNLTMPSPYS